MTQLSSKTLLASALIVLSAALFVLNLGGYLGPAREVIVRPLAGAQQWVSQRYFAARKFLTAPRESSALQAQIEDLEATNAALEDQIIVLQEQAAEAEILRALLDFARASPESRYLAASVIGLDPSPFVRSISIGAGSDRGLTFGMPVVSESGLVGRIIEVNATFSRVQLITDPQAAVSVRLQNSRADALVVAQTNGELQVEQISHEVEVSQGELVLTSGLGGMFPPDVPVGHIVSVRTRDFELFQQAVLEPAVDFEGLEIVLVITNFRTVDQLPAP
ncbi:MAG: rod shape-determining protein MreC [Anaerolineales bacterium]